MIDDWVSKILADPLTKLAATPQAIGLQDGVIDARRYLANTAGYRQWHEGQVAYEVWDKRTTHDYLLEINGVRPVYQHIQMSGRILDVGGGAGTVRHFLPSACEFVSVDPYLDYMAGISPAKRAAYHCLHDHLNFIGACAEFLPFQAASFDWVHMRSVLDHVQSPDLALIEAARVLRPDGRLVIGLWVDGGRSGRRTARQHIKEATRTALVACGITRYKDNHTFHPTFDNLKKIIADNGFEIEDVYWQPQWKDQVCYITAAKRRAARELSRVPIRLMGH